MLRSKYNFKYRIYSHKEDARIEAMLLSEGYTFKAVINHDDMIASEYVKDMGDYISHVLLGKEYLFDKMILSETPEYKDGVTP